MDVKKHALYQLNRTDIFDVMYNVKATTQRFEALNGEPSTTHIDFRTACAVEMLNNALKHGFDKLFEVGVPIFVVGQFEEKFQDADADYIEKHLGWSHQSPTHVTLAIR